MRFKQYKSGKTWVTAGVGLAFAAAMMAASEQSVSANTVGSAASSTSSVKVVNPSSQTASSVPASAASTSAKSASTSATSSQVSGTSRVSIQSSVTSSSQATAKTQSSAAQTAATSAAASASAQNQTTSAPANGFYKNPADGKIYYYKNAQIVKGHQAINGKYYAFDNRTGAMLTGLVDMNQFGQNKVMYFDANNGYALYGTQIFDGKQITIENGTGAVRLGFYTDSKKPASKMAANNAETVTNRFYLTKAGVTKDSQALIGGKFYYFNQDGYMLMGVVDLRTKPGHANKAVVYGNDGTLQYGHFLLNGKYYASAYGEGNMLTGLVDMNQFGQNKVMFFDPKLGYALYGTQTIDGKQISVENGSGKVRLGFYTDAKKPAAKMAANNAETVTNRYYVTKSGLTKGTQALIDGKYYYFSQEGYMLIGVVDLRNKPGHANKTVVYGNDGTMQYGHFLLNGKYYASAYGEGNVLTGFVDMNKFGQDKVMYFDPTHGYALYGSQTVDTQGHTISIAQNTGAVRLGMYTNAKQAIKTTASETVLNKFLVTKKGIVKNSQALYDGKFYYANGDGNLLSGIVNLTNRPDGDRKTVLYGADGAMRYGQQLYQGKYYLFAQGTGAMQVGFQSMVSDGQYKIVYFDKTSGAMLKGIQTIDGKQYVFDPVTGGWQFDGMVKVGNYYYYLNKAGQMVTGQVYTAGHYYLFDRTSGHMLYGFQDLTSYGQNKIVFYDRTTGIMQYGEKWIDGTRYLFDANTGAMYFQPVYYSQLDSRWRNTRIGNGTMVNGCLPTSLSMIVAGYGTNVTALDVAYRANAVGDFNRVHGYGIGTSSYGLAYTARSYGLNVTAMYSTGDIIHALELGRPVMFAVQAPYVPVSWGDSTHEVVATAYSNGRVLISDPYNNLTSGWQDINWIWNNRSRDFDDNSWASTPVYSVYKA